MVSFSIPYRLDAPRLFFLLLLYGTILLFSFSPNAYGSGVVLIQKVGIPGEIDWINNTAKVHFSLDNGADFLSDSFLGSIHRSMGWLLSEMIVDHETKVSDKLKNSPEKEEELNEFIRKNIRVDSHYLSDGTVEVSGEIPLNRNVRDLFISRPPGKGSPIVRIMCPLCGQPWPKGKAVPEGFENIINTADPRDVDHSGLVIYVKDLLFLPCLAPRIINEDGRVIYDLSFADLSRVMHSGLMSYHGSGDDPEIRERAGKSPLTISAVGVAGMNRTDLVISIADSRLVHSSFHNLNLLSQCKVAVVVLD